MQHDLFDLGGELSIPGHAAMTDAHVARVEAAVETFNADLPPLKEFILPGGTRAAALAHVARTVCRRAERSLIRLAAAEAVSERSRIYLNRLSDLLFVLARAINRAAEGRTCCGRRTAPEVADGAKSQERNARLAALMARVALGDQPAFAELYAQTSAHLYGVAVRILRDGALAEEILQEAFVSVWHHAGTYEAAKSQPSTWLAAIVRNRCLDLTAQARIRHDHDDGR